ncbi:CHC2 zinc finger domain-containing protein [Thermosipho sp. (in: thermotogales)]|jgi:DNA primase|uniref:CHC2 zinc finger domain-containing protein n=1 Tax=Thermosipho sp. (in: thermotogales) TaxID=1968895 RepID=UPI00257BF9FC|nr:CHC2 zinc finger domain-containing protein [Thermosipho sp. (in: thermotogales)]MBZ4649153.1 dnaG [Thermosipho sp. (in: thermotogales)]
MENQLIREIKYDIIKRRIDFRLLLKKLGIDYKEKGDELWACCPFHDEKTPSWSINNDKNSTKFGKYKCFGCGTAGDWINLIKFVKEIDTDEAIEFAKALFKISSVNEDLLYQFTIDERLETYDNEDDFEGFKQIEIPDEFEIMTLDDLKSKPYWDYLKYRKISFEVALKHKVMYCSKIPKNKKYRMFVNRVIFPITMDNIIVSFCGRIIFRSYKGKQKVVYPSGSPISRIMFGYDDLDYNLDYCIVCEGPFDKLRLESLGYKNTLANLGNQVTKYKYDIVSNFKRIFVVPDADSGGEVLEQYFKNLKYKKEIYVVDLPEGEDPASASPVDIRKAFINCRKINETLKPKIIVDYRIRR